MSRPRWRSPRCSPALAVWFSDDRRIALIFVGATIFAFIVLRGVGVGCAVARAAGRRACARRALRLAIGNIHRPGALTPSVVLSLGLGLTLLVTLALIDGDLRRQISGSLPERAPNFFFVDIQAAEVEAFAGSGQAAGAGRQADARADAARPRHGAERRRGAEGRTCRRRAHGCCAATAASPMPKRSRKTPRSQQGQWWPKDYAGEPLVSFSAEEAGEIGLKIGDTVTVNVLGRNITARIANLRKVRMGIDGHQLRHGVFAQHLRRRAAFLAGDADDRRTPRPPTRRGSSTP